MKFLFYTIQWWIFISAIIHGNIGSLFTSILGMFVGIVWIFPLFIPEDINSDQ